MNIKRDIRFRVYIAFTCISLMGAAIIARAAWMQAKEGKRLRALAEEMNTRTTKLHAERGAIYSEDGSILCASVPHFDVHVDFSVIDSALFTEQCDSLAIKLAGLFGGRAGDYRKELKDAYAKQHRYWELHKEVTYYEYLQLKTFPIFNKGKNRGGFISQLKARRLNPHQGLAYRTIGLWREHAQPIGLEATYDSVLRGYEGMRVEQRMAGGIWMPIEESTVDPVNGKDIVTTIDPDIQSIADAAVREMLNKYDLQYGTCVVMEVATGKIRALVNLGYQDNGTYWEDLNYALMPTEPGSVFKLVTLTALFNDKYVTNNSIIDAEGGAVRFGNLFMRDSHLGLGKMTVKDAFAHSSNTAHAKLAQQYYYKDPERFLAYVKKLHLHQKTGIDLLGERRPVVKKPESKTWSNTTLPWMATGYEVQVTPLHTCMLYNAVANNGRMMRPYLVSEIREYGKTIYKRQPEVLEQAIGDSATVAQLRACVEEVALTGTAKSIKSPFYTIAGKTGTAQVADKGISYNDGVYQGSFVGYFPAGSPRYTIAVVMRTKRHARTYYGGTIAAPAFKAIADGLFAKGSGWDAPLDSLEEKPTGRMIAHKATGNAYKVLLGTLGRDISVDASNKVMHLQLDSNKKITANKQDVWKGYMPDVNGMGLKDALFLLEQEGLSVHIRGKGRVRAQSVAPGTLIAKGQEVIIELS